MDTCCYGLVGGTGAGRSRENVQELDLKSRPNCSSPTCSSLLLFRDLASLPE